MEKRISRFIDGNITQISQNFYLRLKRKRFSSPISKSNKYYIDLIIPVIFHGLSSFVREGKKNIFHVEETYKLTQKVLKQGVSSEWLMTLFWETRDHIIDEFSKFYLFGETSESFHFAYSSILTYFDDLHLAVIKAIEKYRN